MKTKRIFLAGFVLLLTLFFAAGCQQSTSPDTPVTPLPPALIFGPATGNITTTWADRIFGAGGWSINGNEATISDFASASQLAAYLDSAQTSRAALSSQPDNKTFRIYQINSVPVVTIAASAFAATSAGAADDISTISNIIIDLPSTLTTLGDNLFTGISSKVFVNTAALSVSTTATTWDSTKVILASVGSGATPEPPAVSAPVPVEDEETPANNTTAAKASLTEAITNALALKDALGQTTGEAVVELSDDFIEVVNAGTGFLEIAATSDIPNDTPIVIKGDPENAIEVGLQVSAPNVTLQDVAVEVTDSTKVPNTEWPSGGGYYAPISVREDGVTVENCTITFTGTTSFTTGIQVYAHMDGSNVDRPLENITIRNNTVEVTGNGGSSVSALYIHAWHPSIQITDNTFKSRYQTRPANPSYDNYPSSAIFINRVGEDVTNTDPVISGNILDSDMYSFFFNAMTNVGTLGSTVAGIEALRNNNFATAATTWALNSGEQASVSKKLFNALLKNNTTKTIDDAERGLGYVSLIANSFFNLEQYEISSGNITHISVRGKHIVSDQYAGDSAKNVFETSGSTGIDYGRLIITNGTAGDITEDDSDHHFCLGINSGGEYDYDSDFTPPGNM